MPASRIAALTASATFSTIAGRPMSSGSSSALIAVPIAKRDFDGRPVLSFVANTVACGVMTPSHPPDQTIGIAAISASLRLPCFCNTRRKAWSARMRVKSFTPPLPSVLPMTAITWSAANCPRTMHASSPEASCTFLSSIFATSTAITISSLAYARAVSLNRMLLTQPGPEFRLSLPRESEAGNERSFVARPHLKKAEIQFLAPGISHCPG